VRVVLVIALAIAPACSLFVSLDDLRGDDASLDATGDAPPDVMMAGDAVVDAAVDAATDATDAGGFCAMHPGVQLCDDFDTPDALAFASWSTVVENNGGSVSLIASDDSPPNAVHFHDPAGDGGPDPQCELNKSFLTSATTSMTYQFDIRVETYPTSGAISFNPIKPDLSNGHQIFFSLNASTAAYAELIDLSDGGTFYNQWTLSQRPTPNVWMHVEVDITIAAPLTVTIYLDNTLAMPADTPLDPRFTAGMPLATAGITFINTGVTPAIVDVDNVLFDFH
jgi:hypothetical protein